METQAWLDHGLECEYITKELHRELEDALQHIGAMLNRMIQSAEQSCKSQK
jgi:four helix bundle protein